MLKTNHLWSQPLWTHQVNVEQTHTHTISWQCWYHKAAPTVDWNKPVHLTTIQSITSPQVKEPEWGRQNMNVFVTHQGQGHHVGTPSVCHRAAAWDPRRCIRAHLDWLTQWPAIGSHNVASEMQIDLIRLYFKLIQALRLIVHLRTELSFQNLKFILEQQGIRS